MVTFAQAQERAERWVNGDVPAYLHREVRVREFDLGFVVWAEDREGGPRSDGGAARLVIARDSGETTLWPGLPVGEVIRRYEEEYGAAEEPAPPADERPGRIDLNATSFLLSPPEWLQEAADAMGIPDRRTPAAGPGADSSAPERQTASTRSAAAEPSADAASAGHSVPGPAAGVPSAESPEAAEPVAGAALSLGKASADAASAGRSAPEPEAVRPGAQAPGSADEPAADEPAADKGVSTPEAPVDSARPGAEARVSSSEPAEGVPAGASAPEAPVDPAWPAADAARSVSEPPARVPSAEASDAAWSVAGAASADAAWPEAGADVSEDQDDADEHSVGLPATVLAPALSG
ncbi:hypothetical protein AB0K09_16125, partial [Streptomyces sp. NPDC049577]